jgi:hypothetical protein
VNTQVRSLNERGIARFVEWLESPDGPPPRSILEDDSYSSVLCEDWCIDIEASFDSTYQLGCYLSDTFGSGADRLALRADRGMWAWISLAFMPNLLGRERQKKGLPLAKDHYVEFVPRLAYRLITRAAWELVLLHGDKARVALSSARSPWGDVAEQMTSRQEMYSHPSFWAVAETLYLSASGRQKPGAAAARKAVHRKLRGNEVGLGGVRRLAISFGQFERTYLLRSMSASDIAGILPVEYSKWK